MTKTNVGPGRVDYPFELIINCPTGTISFIDMSIEATDGDGDTDTNESDFQISC
ncbi:MAG: hypothetical protein ACMZ7B_10920 [Balneola sp.]